MSDNFQVSMLMTCLLFCQALGVVQRPLPLLLFCQQQRHVAAAMPTQQQHNMLLYLFLPDSNLIGLQHHPLPELLQLVELPRLLYLDELLQLCLELAEL